MQRSNGARDWADGGGERPGDGLFDEGGSLFVRGPEEDDAEGVHLREFARTAKPVLSNLPSLGEAGGRAVRLHSVRLSGGSVGKISRDGELCASGAQRGWPVNEFKGRHFGGEVVLSAVRWYRRYAVSYRDIGYA